MFLLRTPSLLFPKPWGGITSIRFCSDSHGKSNDLNEEIRVRFAPSPTGFLHLGGLRTAIYNYLFARKNNGKLIVRIEDTDQKRTIADAQKSVFDNLAWAGIQPDESVLHGGEFGPYVQSQRLDIYQENVQQILENGKAYRCFCSEERLETIRKAAIEKKDARRYDGHCRHLTKDEIGERLGSGQSYCIRLNMDTESIDFNDIIFGHYTVNPNEHGGDPILIKSDGFPTYHFANVVDDHYMRITHVLRGTEWMNSTPKHLILYRAFGWKAPKFAHLPLILNADGSKMSKRYDHSRVEYYREQQILPLALINFITSSGGGFHRNADNIVKTFSMDELIENFDVSALSRASKQLHVDRLEDWNRQLLIDHIQDPEKCGQIVHSVQELVKRAYPNDLGNLDLAEQHIRNILFWSIETERLMSLAKLVEGELAFLWILPAIQADRSTFEWIDDLLSVLENIDFEKAHLLEALKNFAKERKIKLGNLMKPLRQILSGSPQGPGVADILIILGKDSSLKRIRRQMQAGCNIEASFSS